MFEKPPEFSPEQIEEIKKSRAEWDKELAEAGATYVFTGQRDEQGRPRKRLDVPDDLVRHISSEHDKEVLSSLFNRVGGFSGVLDRADELTNEEERVFIKSLWKMNEDEMKEVCNAAYKFTPESQKWIVQRLIDGGEAYLGFAELPNFVNAPNVKDLVKATISEAAQRGTDLKRKIEKDFATHSGLLKLKFMDEEAEFQKVLYPFRYTTYSKR